MNEDDELKLELEGRLRELTSACKVPSSLTVAVHLERNGEVNYSVSGYAVDCKFRTFCAENLPRALADFDEQFPFDPKERAARKRAEAAALLAEADKLES